MPFKPRHWTATPLSSGDVVVTAVASPVGLLRPIASVDGALQAALQDRQRRMQETEDDLADLRAEVRSLEHWISRPHQRPTEDRSPGARVWRTHLPGVPERPTDVLAERLRVAAALVATGRTQVAREELLAVLAELDSGEQEVGRRARG